MLLIESKKSAQSVDGATRLLLLERLQETGPVPLIRSARLAAFELALGSRDRVAEMERAIAARTESEDDALYVRGDLFCFEDYVLFLIFGDGEDDLAGMRAGIVYDAETAEPLSRLDDFCRNVYNALDAARRGAGREELADALVAEWKREEPELHAGLSRFLARHARDESSDEPRPQGVERALQALENTDARRFLRRVIEAQADGQTAELLSAREEDGGASASLIKTLADAGLLQREVSVSCRQVGRSLFRLPSPDMLAVITSSNAVCSECGATIADEKIEETLAPTARAASLLADGTWLSAQLRATLRGLGVADAAMAYGRAFTDGEMHLMASVGREPFLFIQRDGDLTAAQTARALDELIETEGRHLVVITTGKIQEEARVRLREHARRRARDGSKIEIILIEGMETAATELQHAFERASHRALADALCELDGSLGLSVGYLIATRFRLAQKGAALTDLAASAVGALAGSLREI
ncbi:MAG: hypothetical protein JO360_14805 [Acidobacteria bacterium]|nr:hypothetical protein [Acidobacteriota bacterium]